MLKGLYKLVFCSLFASLVCLCAAGQAWADNALPTQLTLTQPDKAWLATHPVIRLGIDASYGPYSFIDEQGKLQGAVREFLDYLEPVLGVHFDIISDLDWPQLMAAVQAHRIDAVATVVRLPERDAFLDFTSIYLPTPLVIVTRNDAPQLRSPQELAKLELVLVEGYSSSKQIMALYPELHPHYVKTPLDGLRALASGATDAYVGVLGVNAFLAAQNGIANLKANAAFDMALNGQRFGVRKDWPELARILDLALASMPAQKKHAAFEKWLPLQTHAIERLSQPSLIARLFLWLLVLTGAGVLGYLIILMWNRQLKRELIRRQGELEASAERLRAAEAIAHVGNWQYKVADGSIQWSDETYRIFGVEPQSQPITYEWVVSLIHPDDRKNLDAYLQRMLESRSGEAVPEFQYRLERKNGDIRTVNAQVQVEHDASGNLHVLFGTLQDVTELKKREEELASVHSTLNALVAGSTDLIFVKDRKGRYLVVNQAHAAMLDRPMEDILGADDFALFDAESAERFRADDQRIMAAGQTCTYEEDVPTATATLNYLTTKGPLVIDGQVCGVFGIARDITDRKQIETALVESESRLRLFIEHAPAALAMFDHEMRYMAVSRCWLTEYKLESSDILGELHYDIFPDLPEQWKALHQRGMAGELVRNKQDRFDRADGSTQWLSWEIRPWFASDSSVGGIVIFSKDITERMLVEQALRDSEGRFSATFEQAAVGIAMVSPEGRWMRVNQKLCSIVGYSEAELLSLTFQDITHPDDLNTDLAYVRKMLVHEIDNYTMEKRYHRKGGSQVWVNLTVSLIWKDDEDPDYFISVIEDISARKAVESALSESEAHYRQLFEQNPVPMLVYERGNLHMLAVNEAFARHYGYSRDEASTLLLTDLYPDEEKQAITDFAASLAGLAYVGEWHHLKKDGGRITIEARSHDIAFEGHNARVAVITDITERKRAERSLIDSEVRYRSLLEMAPFPAVISRVRDGTLVYGNHRAELQYGISRENGIGQPAEKFYEDATQRQRFLEPLQKTGKVDDLEVRMLTAEGHPFWALVSASIVNFDNEPAIFTAINDITARKQAEQSLQEQEAFFRQVAENIGDMVAVLDPNGRRLYNSPSYQALFGDPAALQGTDSFSEIHPGDRDKVREVFMKTVRTGRGFRANFRFVLADGSARNIESQGSVILGVAGQVERVVVVSRDVTERKQMEDKILQLNVELEERVRQRTDELATANKELETFTYSVAHDLKAPLRGIDGYSHILLEDYRDKLDETGSRLVNKVRSGVKQMSQLIEDLLAYSHMERRSLQGRSVDLSQLVEQVLDTLQADIQAQGMVVSSSLQGLSVMADPDGLSIVLRNLFDNALKFSRDSHPPTLSINGVSNEKSTTLIIKDNGIGFDMQFHHRIFEIFQRLQRVEDYPGTGVGLAIVLKAMQRMGGRAWAESEPGKGATFFLELPQ